MLGMAQETVGAGCGPFLGGLRPPAAQNKEENSEVSLCHSTKMLLCIMCFTLYNVFSAK